MEYSTGTAGRAASEFSRHALETAPQRGQKRLIIMRHGNPDKPEDLSQQVCNARAALLSAYPDLQIDAILYSPLKRTVRTAGQFYRLHVNSADRPERGLALPFKRQGWLTEDAGAKIGYSGLLKQVRDLDNAWNTVLLVTHSTTGSHIAKSLKTKASDTDIVTSMFDYASALVIDLPARDWKQAGKEPSVLALKIAQPKKPETQQSAASSSAATDTAPPEITSPS